jgi:CubicO group peptidase (beta-lactamase class C family)
MRKLLACLALSAACSASPQAPDREDTPVLDDGFAYAPTDVWRTAAPAALRMDSAAVARIVRDAGTGRFGALHGLLVIRHGYVAVEQYFNSWSAAEPHTMQSVSKSVTSLLFGILHAQRPAVTALSRPALELLPQYAGSIANMDDRKASMTLRDLLMMRTGMDFYEQPYPGSPLDQLNRSQGDWLKLILDTRMRAAPGVDWAYNSGSPILLCGIMREVTGDNVDAFAQRELFEPIGIGVRGAWWFRSPFDALPHCGGGLNLRAADLARVGYLVLRNGRWGGRQLVPAAWIAASTSPLSTGPSLIFSALNSSYGYYWWGFPVRRGGAGHGVIAASGSGGQWLFVVPEYDLVVAIIAQNGAGLDLFYELIGAVRP